MRAGSRTNIAPQPRWRGHHPGWRNAARAQKRSNDNYLTASYSRANSGWRLLYCKAGQLTQAAQGGHRPGTDECPRAEAKNSAFRRGIR